MRSMRRLLSACVFSFVAIAAAAACSSGGAANGTDAGPYVSPCPASPPADGTSCVPSTNAYCEYGGDAHGLCATRASCDPTQHVWRVTTPQPGCGTNVSACPAAYGQGQGGPCPTQSTCEYGEGLCGCDTCQSEGGGQMPGVWDCEAWDVGSGCPAKKPLLGTPCTGGAMCAYWGCCVLVGAGDEMACVDGVWQPAAVCGCGPPPACP